MTARRIIVPGAMPSRDANGRALPAKLRFYEPGTARNELKAVYTDNTLTIAHEQPILSNASGYFVQIWADDAETFDVARSDQVFDRLLMAETEIAPANNAVLASAELAEAAAISADASADIATASEVVAVAAAAAAAIDAATASDAADRAALAAGFDPDDYVQIAAQTLTTPQKVQARTNIGAVAQADIDTSLDGFVPEMLVEARTSNTAMVPADGGKSIEATGTFTQTYNAAATLGDGWFQVYTNRGTGIVTLALTANEVLNSGEAVFVNCDGSTLKALRISRDLGPHVIARHEVASGTASGTATIATYVACGLNTLGQNQIGASLSTKQLTLLAGSYSFDAWSAYYNGAGVSKARLRLRNITDSTTVRVGIGQASPSNDGGICTVSGVFTITAPKVFELQIWKSGASGGSDLGEAMSSGDVEVYSELRVTRRF